MKRKICAALLLIALTAAAGCGNKEANIEPSGTSVPEEKVTSQKNTSDIAATDDNANGENGFKEVRMHDNVNTFSTFLFTNVMDNSEDENVLISPLSVYTALSMLENGADGDTFKEINNALNGYFNLDDIFAKFMKLEPLPSE
ncbi:MAG: hypothetical protein IIT49_05880, partial [Clostridia bacterium]|nr:hypothetical protein [Clostridia bacterium]